MLPSEYWNLGRRQNAYTWPIGSPEQRVFTKRQSTATFGRTTSDARTLGTVRSGPRAGLPEIHRWGHSEERVRVLTIDQRGAPHGPANRGLLGVKLLRAWTGVTVFPTFVCNFSCPFCAFSAELNQHRDELTLEEFDRIARGLGPVLVLHVGGGEPFVRRDLAEVIHTFWRHGDVRRVEIPTNGWDAGRIVKQVDHLLDLCPGLRLNVRVSLDGVAEAHDAARARPGSYRDAVDTVTALGDLARHRPGLSTGVCQTLTAHSQDRALETYRTIRDEIRPDSIVLNACREGSQPDRTALDLLPAAYGTVIQEMNSDVRRGRWWNYPREGWAPAAFLNSLHATVWELIANELAAGRPRLRCAGGASRQLVIYSTGDMALCELHEPIGNLRTVDYSVGALLESPAGRAARTQAARCTKRHEICWHTAAPDPRLNPLRALRIAARALFHAARHGLAPPMLAGSPGPAAPSVGRAR